MFSFYSQHSFDEITNLSRHHSFYLQFSLYEGFSLSVCEAMQLGLVPVVTPVGEISNYCTHLVNSICHHDIDSTVSCLVKILSGDLSYHDLQSNSISYWNSKPSYVDDFYYNLSRLSTG